MDRMQNEAVERLKQMYSKTHTESQDINRQTSTPKSSHKPDDINPKTPIQTQELYTKKSGKSTDNFFDVFMRDKEKSLIMLLIVILLSEKADSTLILALMYIIL